MEDLYFGEIQPHISHYDANPQLKKLAKLVDENEEILLKLLNHKERKLFIDLMNAQSELEENDAADTFIYGFKLGARMVAESLMEM